MCIVSNASIYHSSVFSLPICHCDHRLSNVNSNTFVKSQSTQAIGSSIHTTIEDIYYATLSTKGIVTARATRNEAQAAVAQVHGDSHALALLHEKLTTTRDEAHADLAHGSPRSWVADYYDEWEEATRTRTPGMSSCHRVSHSCAHLVCFLCRRFSCVKLASGRYVPIWPLSRRSF